MRFDFWYVAPQRMRDQKLFRPSDEPCGGIEEAWDYQHYHKPSLPESLRKFICICVKGRKRPRLKVASGPLCPEHLTVMQRTLDKKDLKRSGETEGSKQYPYNGYETYRCKSPHCGYLATIDWIT